MTEANFGVDGADGTEPDRLRRWIPGRQTLPVLIQRFSARGPQSSTRCDSECCVSVAFHSAQNAESLRMTPRHFARATAMPKGWTKASGMVDDGPVIGAGVLASVVPETESG
jgi:hypothetical protein